MAQNIFVIGRDDFYLEQLKTMRNADEDRFHGLIPYHEIVNPAHYPIGRLLGDACQKLAGFAGKVDAIISHWDFPRTCLLPLLRGPHNLRGPGLKSVLKCDNKYWTRLVEDACIAEAAPPYRLVDPFDEDTVNTIDLPYPYRLKPVTGFSSYLVYRIPNRRELRHGVDRIRENIDKFAEPYETFCRLGNISDLPPKLGGRMCSAEAPIKGHKWS